MTPKAEAPLLDFTGGRPADERRPPGQYLTRGFPVLTYGDIPEVDLTEWRLCFHGLVDEDRSFTWKEFLALPQTRVKADFHCVTTWSKLDNIWEGVLVRDLLKIVKPDAEATHVRIRSHGGYTTNLALEVFAGEDCLVAHSHNGAPLPPAHGGPARLVVPTRYAWKSAKWVSSFELLDEDEPGFWEKNGYHNNADPWKEERFTNPGGFF